MARFKASDNKIIQPRNIQIDFLYSVIPSSEEKYTAMSETRENHQYNKREEKIKKKTSKTLVHSILNGPY